MALSRQLIKSNNPATWLVQLYLTSVLDKERNLLKYCFGYLFGICKSLDNQQKEALNTFYDNLVIPHSRLIKQSDCLDYQQKSFKEPELQSFNNFHILNSISKYSGIWNQLKAILKFVTGYATTSFWYRKVKKIQY